LGKSLLLGKPIQDLLGSFNTPEKGKEKYQSLGICICNIYIYIIIPNMMEKNENTNPKPESIYYTSVIASDRQWLRGHRDAHLFES